MKLNRRSEEPTSIAFLSVITCGFGAIILLLIIAKSEPPILEEVKDDPLVDKIGDLQSELFEVQSMLEEKTLRASEQEKKLNLLKEENAKIEKEIQIITTLIAKNRSERENLSKLKLAQQTLTKEMRDLYRRNKKTRTDLVGGVPIDSEYIVFIIDTSGSMFRYAWPTVIKQFEDTLKVYPKVKGIQILNDMGSYMFPNYRDSWIPDSVSRRKTIVDKLKTWNAFSNSSPAEGISKAIESFYSAEKKISLYVYGDEFTGSSIKQVVEHVASVNRTDASGKPLVRIHAIGFPVMRAQVPHLQHTGIKFATLMRELALNNGGTFVGLNAFR